MKLKPVVLTALGLMAGHVAADDGWDWSITPYLWAAGMDGTIAAGNFSADVSMDFADVMNVFEGGALLRFEGTGDTHGVFGDVVYLALEDDEARETTGGTIKVEADSLIGEFGYRRILSDRFALEFGLRYWDFETTLTPAQLPAARQTSDWTDGLIGLRYTGAAGENWNWVLRANLGAGSSDLTIGAEFDLRKTLSGGNTISIGFKALDVDFEKSSSPAPLPVDLTLAGMTIGYTFNL